ncbi:TniB family NTP-binding protein [Silvanigrella sp.]|jgi:hypothetical protein|uniref:TniB family NTP-binding protein n=1 Tax=Silvanigrella sp. TaxID=2024976 RepID=UPI0037C8A273
MNDVYTENNINYDYLNSHAHSIIDLSAEERIIRIRSERWIGYALAIEALSKLDVLFNHPKKIRMPNILIIGPTNNGKSMIVERFKRMHPPQNEINGETIGIPLLTMQMPSDPTIARFYALLLHAMKAPFSMKAKVSDLETVALDLLRKCNVRMLIIDEIHNMLAGRQNVQREFLNLIRFLGNELRIPIVGIGIREAWHAICTDPQLENRFSPIILPLWQDDIEFGKLLASFISSFPLRKQSYIIDNDTRNYILRRSEGTIGEISSLLTKAAIMAIQTGKECIDFSILELTDYESPTERRRQFEREVI